MHKKRLLPHAGIMLLWGLLSFLPAVAQTEDRLDACLTAVPKFEFLGRIERGVVNDLEVSPDGSLLAVASSRGVWLYDASNLELHSALMLPDESAASSLSWSAEGRALAVGYADGLRVWNIERTAVSWWYPKIPDISHIAWSADGLRLAIINDGFISEGMNTTIYSDLRVMSPYQDLVEMRQTDILHNRDQAFWSADGTRLLFLYSDTAGPRGDTDADAAYPVQVLQWSPNRSQPVPLLPPDEVDNSAQVKSATWSPDGTQIAVDVGEGEQGQVEIRAVSDGEILQTLPPGADPTWSSDGSHFAVYQDYYKEGFHVWNAQLESERFIAAGQAQQFVLAPDGSYLYAYQWGTLVAYDTSSGDAAAALDLHPHRQLEAVWSPDGTLLATRYGDDPFGNARVFIWNDDGELFQRITSDDAINSLTWSPDADRLALAKSDAVELWGLREELPLVIEVDAPFRLAWSTDGMQIAVILRSGDVYVWDSSSGDEVAYWPSPVENLSGTANYANSRILWSETTGLRWLIRDWDDMTRVYSFDHEEPLADLGAPDFVVTAGTPQFLPDGRLVYTLRDNMTYVYDVERGEVVDNYRLRGNIARVWPSQGFACYSSASSDFNETGRPQTMLRLYGVADSNALNSLPLPRPIEDTYRSGGAAWSADGRRVAVTLEDGTLALWGLPLENQ